MGFFEFVKNNFFHVLPLFLCAIAAIVILVERIRALFQIYPIQNAGQFMGRISDLVIAGRTPEAVALCDQESQKPLAKLVKSALLRAHQPEELIEHGMELSIQDSKQMIQRRTSYLATIANVATLLGLFGTIAGLIHSFEAVAHADPQQKSALLSAGIATAMNATMTGLGIAIPCMIAFSFLVNRQNRLVSELENASIHMMDLIQQSSYGIAPMDAKSSSNGHKDIAADGRGKVVELRKSA